MILTVMSVRHGLAIGTPVGVVERVTDFGVWSDLDNTGEVWMAERFAGCALMDRL